MDTLIAIFVIMFVVIPIGALILALIGAFYAQQFLDDVRSNARDARNKRNKNP